MFELACNIMVKHSQGSNDWQLLSYIAPSTLVKQNHRVLVHVHSCMVLKEDACRFCEPLIKAGLKFLQLCILSKDRMHMEHFRDATWLRSSLS